MLVLLLVDIYIYVGALGNLQRIVHLEAVTARYGKACDELIYISRAVGRTHLHGLLLRGVVVALCLQRVGQTAHIALGSPAQRHAHQYRAVAVAPADICRCLLMWYKTEV